MFSDARWTNKRDLGGKCAQVFDCGGPEDSDEPVAMNPKRMKRRRIWKYFRNAAAALVAAHQGACFRKQEAVKTLKQIILKLWIVLISELLTKGTKQITFGLVSVSLHENSFKLHLMVWCHEPQEMFLLTWQQRIELTHVHGYIHLLFDSAMVLMKTMSTPSDGQS